MSAWKPLQIPSIKPSRLIKKIGDLFFDRSAAEEGRDELGAAVGLVAAGEAAGNHDDLAVLDRLGKALHAVSNVGACQVADNKLLGVRACFKQGALRIVLAVRTGEDRDQRLGTRQLDRGSNALLRFIGKALDRAGALRLRRVDGFENSVIEGKKLGNARLVAAEGDGLFRCGRADAHSIGNFLRQLGDDRAGHGSKPVARSLFGGKADLIAERHLHHCLGKAIFNRPCACDLARAGKRGKAFPRRFLLFGCRAVKEVNAVTGSLEVSRHDLACQHGRDGEGDKRRRHVMVKEGTGHGVLAADGGSAQFKLGIERTEQRGKGLAPARRLAAELFKEFLQGEICLVIVCTGSDDLSNRGVDRAVRARVRIGAQSRRGRSPMP